MSLMPYATHHMNIARFRILATINVNTCTTHKIDTGTFRITENEQKIELQGTTHKSKINYQYVKIEYLHFQSYIQINTNTKRNSYNLIPAFKKLHLMNKNAVCNAQINK